LNECSVELGDGNQLINLQGATIKKTMMNGKNKNTGFDILFRMQDEKNGYRFTYNSKINVYRFWKQVNGNWVRIASTSVPSEWGNNPMDVQVKLVGDTFTAIKGGQEVLQVRDSAFSEGQVGLRNKPSSKSCFGDFSVKSAP
jgi:hypothetical protein